VALVAYALFGSSRHLVVGATSAAAILSASTVAAVSPDPGRAVALSAALAIIAGVILIAAGLLRLGFVTNFLPEPALVGFLFGMALIIVVRQAGKIVGVSTGEGDFFQHAWHLSTQVGSWSLVTMAVGLGAIAVVVDLSTSFRLSVPTLDTLSELHDELRQRGIALWLARVRGTARPSIEASGLADRLGPTHLYGPVEDAVRAFTRDPPPAPPTSTAPGAAPPGG
jgi:MFS superfamily sulfate permease-like transporter